MDPQNNEQPPQDWRLPYDIFLSQGDIALLRYLCDREDRFSAAELDLTPPNLANLVLYRLLHEIAGFYKVTSLGRLIAHLRPSKVDERVIVFRGFDVRVDPLWEKGAGIGEPQDASWLREPDRLPQNAIVSSGQKADTAALPTGPLPCVDANCSRSSSSSHSVSWHSQQGSGCI